MNAQERESLTQFLDQLVNAKLGQKDIEAESMIHSAAQAQPDSHYLLVQRAMLQNEALNNAQNQIKALQTELASLKASSSDTSFLGNSAWGNHATQSNRPVAPSPIPSAPNPTFSQPTMTGSNNSWLGSMATTAAGVVAGSFLFQGIENLMGHRSYGGFGGNSPGETIVNNYYNSPDQSQFASDTSNFSDAGNLTDTDFMDSIPSDDGSDWV